MIINTFPNSPQLVSSTKDGLMSKADKAKLDTISANANNYTHPATHDASIITQSASYRFVTDTEKATWNSKASTTLATTSTNGLMSSTDKTNLANALTRITTLETNYNTMLAKLKTAVFIE